AVNVIERGSADCMIVGGCGSNIQPVDLAKFSLYEELSRYKDDPAGACRPFDRDRDGTVAGEGAAAFVVETLKHAQERGAEIYAEILGLGAGCDGRGPARDVSGSGLVHAIRTALNAAGLSPEELGHINAQSKASPREDVIEAQAYHRALGEAATHIPVTALQSYFGHSDAGSGALQLAGSLLALKHGQIPATLNYQTPDPQCELNVVHGSPMDSSIGTSLSVNRTNLGQSAAVVLRRL
ncbi:MAG: beta-ketoacyl-[acyl-carrier-protein] synthase family protein, partial [Planctomycetaceae bacterium]|nr:beta-ketoacyl-[acyl-carrier-protein] synthase family protein [Planctomycetaceae bacterium]